MNKVVVLFALIVLASCAAAPEAKHPGVGHEGPVGTGPPQYEPGFSRLCQFHPHEAPCP